MVKVETHDDEFPNQVVGVEERETLMEVADKGFPVQIDEGDNSGDKVIVVSKPYKSPSATFRGKSYPIVTIDRLRVGIYKQIVLDSNESEEIQKRKLGIDEVRRALVDKEKEEYEHNKYLPEY